MALLYQSFAMEHKVLKNLRKPLIALAIALGVGYGAIYGHSALTIAAAFKARMLCIAVFEGGRTEEHVLDQELSDFGYLSHEIDHQKGRVNADFFDLVEHSAQFQPGWGCRLPFGLEDPLPEVAPVPGEIDLELTQSDNADLIEAVDDWFEPDLKTQAVIVADASGLLHEAYTPGVGPGNALIGWSMSKSAVHAMMGRLIQEGRLASVDEPLPQPLWHQQPDDPRAAITWENMLRMTTGLEWNEAYGRPSDVTRMLFASPSADRIPADKALAYPVGTHWEYSSGTSNVLAVAAASLAPEYPQPMRTLLFEPLGMNTAYAGTDAYGSIIGSSFVTASPRDWIKLGRLYLQDGIWQGRRLLPEGWVAHAAKETALDQTGDDIGRHGAHWRRNPELDDNDAYYPGVPTDTLIAQGFDGQFMFIIPSRSLILLRMGAHKPDRETLAKRMAAILRALEN